MSHDQCKPKYLPPEALDSWLSAAATALGLDPSSVHTATLLNVARDVAHNVARPAAPLSTFLLGVAVGRAADPDLALARFARVLSQLSVEWDAPLSEGT